MNECDDDVVVIVSMMSLQKKKKNRESNMIFDGRKIEFWMKKNYSIDDMFIRCIYVLYQ